MTTKQMILQGNMENEGSLQGYVFKGNKHDCYAVADFINNELAKANHKLPAQSDYESEYSGHWQSYSESTSYGRGNW